jgi:hypothetical protein
MVALRWARVARILALVADLILVGTLVALSRRISAVGVASLALTALALLAAAPFLGPMPTPEEEGQRR